MDPQQELQIGQVRNLVLLIFFFFFFFFFNQNIQFDSMKIFKIVKNICMTEKKINTAIKQQQQKKKKNADAGD